MSSVTENGTENQTPTLYVVIPCYNEQEVLPNMSSKIESKLVTIKNKGIISKKSKVIFVNDGSSDNTWEYISQLSREKPVHFGGVNLSRNQGHQNALFAGLMTVRNDCDVTISMDADLQDDIEAIDEMLEKYKAGADIVYGVRSERATDRFLKKFTAELFYKFMVFMGADIVFNHADYRLMGKRSLDGLAEFREVNLFLRGIVPLIGYKTEKVYYERKHRQAGESKYSISKMLSFAFDGITSFSIRPIRLISSIGGLVLLIGFILLIYSGFQYIYGNTVHGWFSVLVSIWMIGGALMISMGIVGEYIGKIYMEVKARPRFIIEEYINKK